MKRIKILLVGLLMGLAIAPLEGQTLNNSQRQAINKALSRTIDQEVMGGSTRIQKVEIRGRRLRLYCSIGLANYPFRPERIEALYDTVRHYLPASLKRHHIELYTDGHNIEELVPLHYRTPKAKREVTPFTHPKQNPLTRPLNALNNPTQGLQGHHIALWQSHGRYFDQATNQWRWQRTAHWQTREDLFTQSFVLPYLLPMLERAGAHVLLPRERDLNPEEWVVDNDPSPYTVGHYEEFTGKSPWQEAALGFGYPEATLTATENPFRQGTSRATRSITRGEESLARWTLEPTRAGRYTLYISYQTLPESCDEVHYTVHHAGGESRFAVNQQMGGGTWIALGEFEVEESLTVTLSNRSSQAGQLITADAIRLGGGYGNVARTPCDSLRHEGMNYRPQLSGMRRSDEGARYWLQWAGYDTTVYAPKGGTDDYKEDYMSRAHWVNALMGGSSRLPDQAGLAIPIDLALAFHTDAGVRDSDETIGTLGIFYTRDTEGEFEGGASRYLSRDLTDLVMSEVVGDIRRWCEPEWRRRGLWNRAYYEARVPAAPTMLLELLSHQNLADMRYGHDPKFKFVVARSIYKGMLKHIAAQYRKAYVVQPLPVEGFCMEREGERSIRLKWQPRHDPGEPSATPTHYLLYTAQGEGAFDTGRKIEGCALKLDLEPGTHYRFRITACNAGGESFASETLAAYIHPQERGHILILNGFTRVSAAPSFRSDFEAGFCLEFDSGAADGRDISYIGRQQQFDRTRFRDEDPATMLGACTTEWEGEYPAGNRLDYPALHGQSIARAGYSYTSASVEALEHFDLHSEGITALDVVLGKQRTSLLGTGHSGYTDECFPEPLQELIRDFTSKGVSLFISGSYVASDLWNSAPSTNLDRAFAREVLGYELEREGGTQANRLRLVAPELGALTLHFHRELNTACYAVESPDALRPTATGFSVARFPDTGLTAGVAQVREGYRSVVLSLPFEAIAMPQERDRLMQQVLQFLNQK